jgi:hypothetical protein
MKISQGNEIKMIGFSLRIYNMSWAEKIKQVFFKVCNFECFVIFTIELDFWYLKLVICQFLQKQCIYNYDQVCITLKAF